MIDFFPVYLNSFHLAA